MLRGISLVLTLLPMLLLAAPKAPSKLKLVPSTTSVDIFWQDNSDDETGFKIFRDGKLIYTTNADTTHFTDKGLVPNTTYRYTIKATDDKIHRNIITTIFWIGEDASEDNGNIPNQASAWDDMWMTNYGGVDTPDKRNGYYPKDFIPKENPFYVALPYNDFDDNGEKKPNLSSYIPWVKQKDTKSTKSVCKNRWVMITKNGKSVFAQWEDVGPFGEDDVAYVFGDAKPKNSINNHAGLDVSPAVRDYLGLKDIDKTTWQFVDEKDVPDGPWKEIVTDKNVNWVD